MLVCPVIIAATHGSTLIAVGPLISTTLGSPISSHTSTSTSALLVAAPLGWTTGAHGLSILLLGLCEKRLGCHGAVMVRENSGRRCTMVEQVSLRVTIRLEQMVRWCSREVGSSRLEEVRNV